MKAAIPVMTPEAWEAYLRLVEWSQGHQVAQFLAEWDQVMGMLREPDRALTQSVPS